MKLKFLLNLLIITAIISCESNSETTPKNNDKITSDFVTDLEFNFDTENYHLLFNNKNQEELMIVLRLDTNKVENINHNKIMLKNMLIQPLSQNATAIYLGNKESVNKKFKYDRKLTSVNLDLYTFNQDDSTYTLQESFDSLKVKEIELVKLRKPSQPAYNLAFNYDIEKDATTIMWQKGTGEKSIIIGKRILDESDSDLTYPADTKDYDVANFDAAGSGIENSQTFVLFKSIDPTESKHFMQLAPGRYAFAVLEANGEGKNIAYRLPDSSTVGNPRYYTVMPKPPVINEPTDIKPESFMISWSKVDGTTAYKLDVATDEAFQNIVTNYQEFDTGEYNEWMIHGLNSGTKYYLRVKARTKYGETQYSKTKEITTK